jgi:hypothetical protein
MVVATERGPSEKLGDLFASVEKLKQKLPNN